MRKYMSKHTPGPWDYRDSMDGGCMTYCNYNGCPETHPTGYFLIDGPEWDEEAAYAYGAVTRNEADARLIAAAPELLESQTMGQSVNTPDFIDWMADRLVHVYGESENVDFIRSARERAEAGRLAIAKAVGNEKL